MAKKILALALAVLMLLGMVACAQNATPETENQEPAQTENTENTNKAEEATPDAEPAEEGTLEWYYRGNGIQRDTEAVNDHVNELLHQIEGFENISVHLNPYLASDYATAVTLAQSTGEQIDILSTVGLNFVTEVNNGTFLPLKDMLAEDQFASLKNELPEWLWEAVTIGDSPYVVPSYQRGSSMYYLIIPAKYAENLDLDAIREMFKGEYTAADVDNVMKQIVDAAREVDGVDSKYLWPAVSSLQYASGIQYMEFISGYGNTDGFVIKAGDTKAENFWVSDEFKNAVESAATLNAEGYTVPDIMLRNLDDLIGANAMNDEAIVTWITNGAGTEEHVSEMCTSSMGFDVIALPIHQDYYFSSNWAAGGNGVTASSAHPVEALKFLQLINTEAGEEIYNTIVYGLEGVEYEKIDDTHIKTLEYDGPQASDNSYSAHKWIMGNTFHAWLNQGCSDEDNEIAMQINEATDNVVSPAMGFRFDNSAVTTELDQINAVVTEYFDTLRFGAKGADWEGYYNEFVEKMNAAGVEKVQNEIQTQFDAFLASK